MAPASRRGQRTEDALLAAAREVFATKGYFNAKIADITALAGRSPGSFYNYYENKSQLLDALLEQFSAEVTEAALLSMTDDPYESIRGTVAAYWNTFREHKGAMIGLFHLSMTEPDYAKRWQAVRATGIRGIAASLHVDAEAGRLPDVDVTLTASAIVSMMESFSMTWLGGIGDVGVPTPDDDAAIDTLSAFWFSAVHGPDAAKAALERHRAAH